MTAHDLEVVWDILETDLPEEEVVRVRATEVAIPAGDVLLGTSPDGRRHLLVPLPAGAGFAPDTRTRGVHLTKRSLDTGSGIVDFLDVECRVERLNPLFAVLAGEMVDAVVAASEQPVGACREVLDRWRDFLGADRPGLLSEARLVGLMAELWVVTEVVRHDPQRRLDVWLGPSGARHDLRRSGYALEVKGTLAREGKFVEIHGVEQLSPTDEGTLHLAWLRFEQDDTAALSVPALARGLRDLGVDAFELAQAMALAGYDPTLDAEYESRRYRLIESRLYEVDADFPSIVPSSFAAGIVPPGVLRLSYTVDLTNEPPTPLGGEETTTLLTRLATA